VTREADSPTDPDRCPLCRGDVRSAAAVYATEPGAVCPTHCAVVCESEADARAWPDARLEIVECPECSLVFNRAFDPRTQRFGEGYEEAQNASGVFSAFEAWLVRTLVEDWGVRRRRVLEIGCGKGSFLRGLAREGANECVGYDPAYVPMSGEPSERVRFERKLYTPDADEPPADVVLCRHTLEHIRDLRSFGAALRRAVAPGGLLVLEVPDLARIAAEGAFWDCYYEHANLFGAGTLSRFVAEGGFSERASRAVYHNQYRLSISARGSAGQPAPGSGASIADSMRRALMGARERWSVRLRTAQRAGRCVVLWGSGSKAVGFLMGVGEAAAAPVAAVDIQPRRHGKFVPGFALPIISPASLAGLRPDLVIAMNAVYRDEIAAELNRRGVRAELCCLGEAPA